MPSASCLCSSHSGCDDSGRGTEAGQAQRTMGNTPWFPRLRRHGCVLLPGGPCQPSRHGGQIPALAPGAGCAPAHPAGAVGLPGGRLPRPARPPPPDGHGLWLRPGLPALQPGGDGVAVLQHLPDSHFDWHTQLDPLLLTSCPLPIHLHATGAAQLLIPSLKLVQLPVSLPFPVSPPSKFKNMYNFLLKSTSLAY